MRQAQKLDQWGHCPLCGRAHCLARIYEDRAPEEFEDGELVAESEADLRDMARHLLDCRRYSLLVNRTLGAKAVKMGNCACGIFSSRLNAAGQCMACASRDAE